MKAASLLFLLLLPPLCSTTGAQNAFQAATSGINYAVEGAAGAADGATPLWLNANKYGLSSIKGDNGYLRAGIFRSSSADSLRNWRIGFGADMAVAYNFTSSFILQQLYADIDYKKVRLSIGSKERPANLKDAELSTGSQTLGTNARPIPEIRFEIPEYLSLDKGHWLAVRGHIGYGFLTDGSWQESYTGVNGKYGKNVLYHSKSGFLRIGNEDKFPLVLEGGLEMGGLFGGKAYLNGKTVDMGHSLESFGSILIGSGHDPTDGKYPNAEGNIVGSWLFSLSYKLNDWKIRAYYDHFFEDHSAMFFNYGWKDGLYGLEITLPRNPIVSKFVYEYITTEYQSGPIYHDATDELPTQISANDKYYDHLIYNGWQHWGQAIGNPLFTSPLYSANNRLYFYNTRFKAHHFGLSGSPLSSLHYRMLFSYSRNKGTYNEPFVDFRYNTSFLAELTYAPRRIGRMDARGWSLRGAFALDRGKLLGDNTGFMLTLRKEGRLTF